MSEIVSFTTTMNARSLATMKRIGMQPDPARNFLMPGIDDGHAALRPHLLYAISQSDWQQKGR